MSSNISVTTLQWIIMALGAFGIGLSKTGIAGFGIVAIAVFTLALPARISVGVVLPLLIVGDICAVSFFRRKAVWRHLVHLFPWAALGVGLGYLALGRIDGHQMARLIGVILLLLTAMQIARRYQLRKAGQGASDPGQEGVKQSPAITAVMGMLAGFTTMVANAAGPIMVLYLLGTRLPKVEFIGTQAWFFFILNAFKVPFSVNLDMINRRTLPIDALVAPMVVLGAFTGRRIVHKIDQRLFELIATTLTVIAGIKLILPG